MQLKAADGWPKPVTAEYPARTTADSVLDQVLGDVADTAWAPLEQAQPSRDRTTSDSVLSAVLKDVAETSSASAAPHTQARSRRRTTDSLLDVQLPQSAHHSSAVPVTQAGTQPSSTGTTVDNVVDMPLHEAAPKPPALSRRSSAVADTLAHPGCSSRRDTADSVLEAVLREVALPSAAASQLSARVAGHSAPTGAPHTPAGHVTHDPHECGDSARAGGRSTADSALDHVLDDIEDADQAYVDSLFDAVLNEVAGEDSRQRTTADSVLDAMLDDLSSSRGPDQEGVLSRSDEQRTGHMAHLQQDQAHAVSVSLSCASVSHGASVAQQSFPHSGTPLQHAHGAWPSSRLFSMLSTTLDAYTLVQSHTITPHANIKIVSCCEL